MSTAPVLQPRALIGNSRARPPVVLVAIGLSIWLISAMPAHARQIYEWREPGGTVAYSQLPPRPQDGVLLRELEVAELQDGHRPAASVNPPAGDVQAASWQRADAKVAAALAGLQSAERAQRVGKTPLPGERRHLVDGHSRLSRGYFDRLAALDDAVLRARNALQAADAERNALAFLPR